jgi:hypothetical protein
MAAVPPGTPPPPPPTPPANDTAGGSSSTSKESPKCPKGFKWSQIKKQCVRIGDPFTPERTLRPEEILAQQSFREPDQSLATPAFPTPAPKEEEKLKKPRVFRDKNGKATGVELPDGRVFLGLSPDEVENVLTLESKDEERFPRTTASIEEKELQKTKDLRAELGNLLAANIGDIQPTGDVEQDKLNYSEAFLSAFDELLIGAGGGAVAGVGVPVVGSVVLGIGGAIGGYYVGVQSNLRTQKVDMIKGEAQNLMKSEQNLLKIVMMINQGQDPTIALNQFNAQLSLISEAHANLEGITSDFLADWVGEDGHRQLEKFKNFYSEGGMKEIVEGQLSLAMRNPDPKRNEFLAEQIQEITEEMQI